MKGISIAGGGIAGLSLAVGLRGKGVPVTVFEAGRYPRHRVCGEFISGVDESTLEALGVKEELADARRHRSVVWFRGEELCLEGELPAAALGISRFDLDQRLRNRVVESGGEVMEGVREKAEAVEGKVWAAGRPAGGGKGSWIGLKCHLKGWEELADLEMHLGSNGYVGVTPVEDGWVNVCGLFRLDRSCKGQGAGLMGNYLRAGGLDRLAGRIERAEVREASFLGVTGFELGWQAETAGVCAIGDAGGMIPPFTGNGMSMAFEWAEMAVDPLAAWAEGRADWRDVEVGLRTRARRKFRRRLASGLLTQRMLLSGRFQGAVSSILGSGLVPFRPLLSLYR